MSPSLVLHQFPSYRVCAIFGPMSEPCLGTLREPAVRMRSTGIQEGNASQLQRNIDLVPQMRVIKASVLDAAFSAWAFVPDHLYKQT